MGKGGWNIQKIHPLHNVRGVTLKELVGPAKASLIFDRNFAPNPVIVIK